jgi:uncharacterized protein YdeI (YjbR/CyaY-like superfamily)
MRTLYFDLETFSTTPITHGTHAYAAAAEILLAAWAWDDEPVRVTDFTALHALPQYVVEGFNDPDVEVVIHNSHFDRTVVRHAWGIDIPTSRIHDTMVQAMAHSLPGSLGMLCEVLGLPSDKAKDKDGKRLIQLFTKPLGKNRKLDRATRETHPEEWERFKAYAASDIEAMREVKKRMPMVNFTPAERELWLKIHKKGSGLPTVTYAEALEVALCWGWIDGQKKSFDERSFLQRFTPRGRTSLWSAINVGHVERLVAEGRMTEHGLRHVEAAKAEAAPAKPPGFFKRLLERAQKPL